MREQIKQFKTECIRCQVSENGLNNVRFFQSRKARERDGAHIYNRPFRIAFSVASVSKRDCVRNHSHENEFRQQVHLPYFSLEDSF